MGGMRNLLKVIQSKTPEERVALALAVHRSPRTIENVVAGDSCGTNTARKIAAYMGRPHEWWQLVPDNGKAK
jgi:plasmid maintenance system antidote protein VapI